MIHGNSLTNEEWLVYRTGFNGLGVIQELKIEDCPRAVQQAAEESQPESFADELEQSSQPAPASTEAGELSAPQTPIAAEQPSLKPKGQLRLF